MVHVDIKELGNVDSVGHKAQGRATGFRQCQTDATPLSPALPAGAPTWTTCTTPVDDHSRLAHTVMALDLDPDGHRVRGVYAVTNPDKLTHTGSDG